MLRAGNRAKELVQQILTFAHKGKEERRPVQVSLIANEALNLLRASLPTSIEIQKNIRSNAHVLSDTTHIHQIMMNLCTNAAKAMSNGGVLAVTLQEVELDESFVSRHLDASTGKYLQLTVRDTGMGISPEIKTRIFDPFFTTRCQGKGTGLGLSVVHGIVKKCQGIITVTSEPGQGSTFDVFLPVVDGEMQALIATNEGLPHGNERILFVDDEQTLVNLAKDMLSNLGYTVTGFTRSYDAIETFRHSPAAFDLVITDMTMPKMTGDRLAAELFAIRPDIPIILCTGYSEKLSEMEAHKAGIKRLVMKPVKMHILATIIRETLADAARKLDDGDKKLDHPGASRE